MSHIWVSTTPRYDRKTDSIELVDQHGDVLTRLHRNAVIRMLGMLPSVPPRDVEDEHD